MNESIKTRITYHGNNGTIYSVIEEYEEDDMIECGHWVEPFPNEEGNTTAFGLCECLAQSSDCPPILREEGIKEITVQNWVEG